MEQNLFSFEQDFQIIPTPPIDWNLDHWPANGEHTSDEAHPPGHPVQETRTAIELPEDAFTSVDGKILLADPREEGHDLCSLLVSTEIADHLVELYFESIQPILPLLQRSEFYPGMLGSHLCSADRYQHLDWETALILNGMFALSARFSRRKDFRTLGQRRDAYLLLREPSLYVNFLVIQARIIVQHSNTCRV